MDPDGSNIRQVSNFKTVSTFPGLSPDGKKIVFRMVVQEAGFDWSLNNTERNSEIFVMNSDGLLQLMSATMAHLMVGRNGHRMEKFFLHQTGTDLQTLRRFLWLMPMEKI